MSVSSKFILTLVAAVVNESISPTAILVGFHAPPTLISLARQAPKLYDRIPAVEGRDKALSGSTARRQRGAAP